MTASQRPSYSQALLSIRGALFVCLALLILWLPIPAGSNRPLAVIILQLWVFGAASFFLGYSLVSRRLASLAGLVVPVFIWLLWIAWIAIQSIPLPADWVMGWSPQTVELHGLAAQYNEEHRDQLPLSLAVDKTMTALWLTLALFALYCLVYIAACKRRLAELLCWAIVISGLFQAMYGSLMLISGASIGFFGEEIGRTNSATGTFVNRNHLAGYMEISSAVGIGLILGQMRGGSWAGWRVQMRRIVEAVFSNKILLRAIVCVMVVALVLSRSRGGNTAFFISLGVCGLIYLFFRERRLFGAGLVFFTSLFLIDLWIVSSWFGFEQVVERLEETTVETEARTSVFASLIPMMTDFRLTGIGLGAFESVYPFYRPMELTKHYDHAHNDYAEFFIETGIIGSVILAALVLWTYWHCLRVLIKRRDRFVCGIAFSCLMAMTAIAIHSAVDFNLQIPANAATLIVVMAMAASLSPHSRRHRRRKRRDSERESSTEADEEAAPLTAGRQQEAPAPVFQDRARLDDLEQPGSGV